MLDNEITLEVQNVADKSKANKAVGVEELPYKHIFTVVLFHHC